MLTKWWVSSASTDIKPLPFLSPLVIEHLDVLIQKDWHILEHGSGGSTLWFAQRCKQVTAVEAHRGWYNEIKAKHIPNINMVYNQGVPDLKRDYDMLLIDGEPLEDRAYYLRHAYDLVKPGGYVVLDNANRPHFAAERGLLQEDCLDFKTYDGNEPGTKFLITEFYHLRWDK